MKMPFTSVIRATACSAIVTLVMASPALSQSVAAPVPAQTSTQLPPVARTANLSGPRFGLTLLSDATVAKLKDRSIELERPFVSQFGWQFERQFFTRDSGVTMVTE